MEDPAIDWPAAFAALGRPGAGATAGELARRALAPVWLDDLGRARSELARKLLAPVRRYYEAHLQAQVRRLANRAVGEHVLERDQRCRRPGAARPADGDDGGRRYRLAAPPAEAPGPAAEAAAAPGARPASTTLRRPQAPVHMPFQLWSAALLRLVYALVPAGDAETWTPPRLHAELHAALQRWSNIELAQQLTWFVDATPSAVWVDVIDAALATSGRLPPCPPDDGVRRWRRWLLQHGLGRDAPLAFDEHHAAALLARCFPGDDDAEARSQARTFLRRTWDVEVRLLRDGLEARAWLRQQPSQLPAGIEDLAFVHEDEAEGAGDPPAHKPASPKPPRPKAAADWFAPHVKAFVEKHKRQEERRQKRLAERGKSATTVKEEEESDGEKSDEMSDPEVQE